MPDTAQLILGLPYLRAGTLLDAAQRAGAPVLVSANSFSRWQRDGLVPSRIVRSVQGGGARGSRPTYLREWTHFRLPPPSLSNGGPVCLDSAGFVATARYRRFPWTVQNYIDLCAAFPWEWCAAMDLCVEPEIAGDEPTVLDRIAGTARLNRLCMRYAEEAGIADRMIPVVQGWSLDHYLRCIDKLSDIIADAPLIGIGSMCRRPLYGATGLLNIVEGLDRALGTSKTRFHLFGVKSGAYSALKDHPRVASVDSQAYGTEARRQAIKRRKVNPAFSKTDRFVADVMMTWYRNQLRQAPVAYTPDRQPGIELSPAVTVDPLEERLEAAREELRDLMEAGEIDLSDISHHHVLAGAFDE